MQAGPKKNLRFPWALAGFGIGVSISFLASFGISGLLFMIEQFKLPEEELAIFTSLFYGIVFFIALGGMRTEIRRNKMLVTGKPYAKQPLPPASKSRETFDRIKTVLWYGFGIFSLGWLTPALIIYWMEPRHPDWAVSVCAYLFSFVAGTAYALKKADMIRTGYNYVVLYAGVGLGALLADRLLGVVHP